jgi:hypothetical protein
MPLFMHTLKWEGKKENQILLQTKVLFRMKRQCLEQ